MNITEIKAVDDLIGELSFSGSFSLDEAKYGYNITPMSDFADDITKFNNLMDAAFFKFFSILQKIESQYHEQYINYFDYKLKERLIALKIYSGGNNSFYLFLKNKHGF